MSSIGPRLKIIRRLGTQLPGLTRKDPGDSPYPPGQHGPSGKRRKVSEYARLLAEKQKVRFNYGVSERQLRTILGQASRMEGRTGDNVLVLLERRLDNVVFRLGFCATIPAARQLISHGHILVNGRRVDRPSMRVKRGDRISVAASGQKIPNVIEQVERGPVLRLPEWLAHDPDHRFSARALGDPRAADAPFLVNAKALVEFYAR